MKAVLILQVFGLRLGLALSGQPTLSSSAGTSSTKKQAVVVGGGPVGLAAAITLSKPPHNYQVRVLEKTSTLTPTFDPGRSYVYNINPRGMTWVDSHPAALDKLQEAGTAPVGGIASITYIPADPKEPIPDPKNATMGSYSVKLQQPRVFWIPRHSMVGLLLDCCRDLGNDSVQVLSNKTVVSLRPSESNANGDAELVTVQCEDGSCYDASLVVAADGIDSTVRNILAGTNSEASSVSPFGTKTWLRQHDPSQFKIRQYKSPATGIKMKSLTFPPDFKLSQSDGSRIDTRPDMMYIFRTVNTGRDYLSLGLLPIKDPTMPRSVNVCTRYDHEVWSLKTGAQAKEWFQRSFPRINFDETISSAAEWDRFAAANGTTFPFCQYSPGSVVCSRNGKAGVVLLGDACHAFPPDIGQGINAGLLDVVALDRALQGQDIETGVQKNDAEKPATLGAALLVYQQNRGPEHRALIRLARFGSPYQYKQSWRRDRIGRFFWTANVAFRLLLNKITFGLIPPAVIMMMVQQPELSFRRIMRRADVTVLGMQLALLACLVRLLLRKTMFGL